MAASEDTPMPFAAECIGDGLDEHSQFFIPPVVERERMLQCPFSNGARFFIQGHSPSRTKAAIVDAPSTDGRIDSMNRGLSSENTTNQKRHLNHSRSSTEEISIEEYDVLTQVLPTMSSWNAC